MSGKQTVVVSTYDERWPEQFLLLRARLDRAMADITDRIEHVGSTSVPGLAAKPIIDIDIIIAPDQLAASIDALSTIDYVHRGELGIEGRHAFRLVSAQGEEERLPRHNLYVCIEGSESLRNHLLLRDYLREHPDRARAYGALKLELAATYPDDIDAYIEGKTAFILAILKEQGMSSESLAAIDEANKKN